MNTFAVSVLVKATIIVGAALGWVRLARDTPSVFAALERQVGVRLEKTRGPRGYVVIDRVEPLVGGR